MKRRYFISLLASVPFLSAFTQRRTDMDFEKIVAELEGYEFDKFVQHGDGIGFVFQPASPNVGNPKTLVVPNLAEVYIEE